MLDKVGNVTLAVGYEANMLRKKTFATPRYSAHALDLESVD